MMAPKQILTPWEDKRAELEGKSLDDIKDRLDLLLARGLIDGYLEGYQKAQEEYQGLVEAAKGARALLIEQYEIVLGHYPDCGKYEEVEVLEEALAKLEEKNDTKTP